MIVIKSTYFTSIVVFFTKKLIINLKFTNNDLKQKLIKFWKRYYCNIKQCKNNQLLIWNKIKIREFFLILSTNFNKFYTLLPQSLIYNQIISKCIIYFKLPKLINILIKDKIKMDAIYKMNSSQLWKSSFIDWISISQIQILLITIEYFHHHIFKVTKYIIKLFLMIDLSKDKKILVVRECINIYTIFYNCLFIEKIKLELEDFCFYCLYPNEYKKIVKLLDEHRIDRERYIDDFVSLLRYFMLQENIIVEIYGRPKHIYSIWRKMQKKYLTFDKLFDVRAVRIIVECLEDCYTVLGIVHTNFRYLPDEFDDYIANPKPNGYQSIHTIVLGINAKTVEIQIRTKQMHKNAELGIAAHWKYKKKNANN